MTTHVDGTRPGKVARGVGALGAGSRSTRRRARVALLPTVVAAIVVTLTGCAEGGATDGPAAAAPSPTSSLGPAPTVTPLPELTPVPDAVDLYAQLNSADGEFPDAVVEAGQAACERASYLVQVSAEEFRAALDGPLALADTAVPLLCPVLLPDLALARGGIGDGETPVGDAPGAVPPGEYRTVTAGSGCTWSVTGRSGGVTAQGRVAAPGEETSVVVGELDGAVSSQDCGIWLPVSG